MAPSLAHDRSRVEANSTARVGIALAMYNPELISFREQLVSIREQSHSNWFCVITADSPLAPLSTSREVGEFFNDPRFEWHENAVRRGHRENFARAIELCVAGGARFIACADQDDVWYSNKISELVSTIEDKPLLSVVHADMDVLVDGKKIAKSAWELERRSADRVDPTSLLVRNVVTGASMIMDAELARRYPAIPAGAVFHDHWYAILASFHGGVYALHKRLHAYRQHTENVVGIRPYRGFFDGMTFSEILEKREEAVTNFRARRDLARAVDASGVQLTPFQRVAFTRTFDGGLGLVGFGAASVRDPSVVRECIALAAGKLLSAFSGE